MTNFEYWKDRILEISNENQPVALKNGEPIVCGQIDCKECGLDSNILCNVERIKWLYSEHVETPKLTKRERIFCETILYPDDKKITRAFEDLFIGTKGKLEIAINPYMFSFIEKGNPWSVSDLLQLEVEE